MEIKQGSTTTGKWQKVWSTILMVASSNKMSEKSKQAERSVILAERLHLEAIGVDWLCELDWSSIANFDPSHSKSKSGSNTPSQKTRRLWQCKTIDSTWEANKLAFKFLMLANHVQLLIARACMQNGNGTVNGNSTIPFRQNGMKTSLFFCFPGRAFQQSGLLSLNFLVPPTMTLPLA